MIFPLSAPTPPLTAWSPPCQRTPPTGSTLQLRDRFAFKSNFTMKTGTGGQRPSISVEEWILISVVNVSISGVQCDSG